MVSSSCGWKSKDLATAQSHEASRQGRAHSLQMFLLRVHQSVWPRLKAVCLQHRVWARLKAWGAAALNPDDLELRDLLVLTRITIQFLILLHSRYSQVDNQEWPLHINSGICFHKEISFDWTSVSFARMYGLEIALGLGIGTCVYLFSQHCHVMWYKLLLALCMLLPSLFVSMCISSAVS